MANYVVLSGTPEPCVFLNRERTWTLFMPETAHRRHFNNALFLETQREALRLLRELHRRVGVLDKTALVLDADMAFDEDGNYVGWESISRRLEVSKWNFGTSGDEIGTKT